MKVAVILCGGSGTRLWPLSTTNKPKQFLKLINDKTLIENTIDRIPNDYLKIFVSNSNFKDEIRKYVTNKDIVIYESHSRNTGQAICLAILKLKELYSTDCCNIIVLPCDHIFDTTKFNEAIDVGMNILGNNIITFGIKPAYPEINYGYIKIKNENIIDYFIEKPSYDKCIELIENDCLWNSGIFMFKLNHILDIYNTHNKENIGYCQESLDNAHIINNEIFISDIYKNTVSISFDHLIMEKIQDIGIVIKYNDLWSDIGDWKSIYDFSFRNNNQNIINGNNITTINTDKSFIYSDNGKLITIGITDLIIVKIDDNLLIMNKNNIDEFRKYINRNK